MTFLLLINFQLTVITVLLIYLKLINLLNLNDDQYKETYFRFRKFLLAPIKKIQKAYEISEDGATADSLIPQTARARD